MPDFKIINAATGKVLDVPNADPTNGVPIQQWDDNGNLQQKWRLVDIGNNLVKIVNVATGKVLDVPNANPADGVLIQQWDDNGKAQQKWNMVALDNGLVKIINAATSKVLDVPNTNTANGVPIQQWDDNGNSQQRWHMVQAATTKFSFDTGDETLKYEDGTFSAFHMQTVVALNSVTGSLSGITRSTSDYDAKGFTGGSQTYVLDSNNVIIYISGIQQVGVDGRWVFWSVNSRTVPWNEQIDPNLLKNANGVRAINFFDPHNRLVPVLQSLPQIITEGGKTWDDIKNALCHAFPSLGLC